jgi:large subunit ribosomal protein L24
LQTTLLGLGVAIILALVAALVGPLLIDWGGYRSIFEAEASHLVGVDVRVTGQIEARLLPSPRLTLHDIEVGNGPEKVRARSLGIEFALAPLMRGEWRATELHLVGPSIDLALDAAGHLQAPNIAVAFNPDALTVERLGIEDGKVNFTDAASGARVTFDKLWFNGEARSLIGPFKGEGAVTIGGELYPFRLASGRYNDDGAIKLHINVDPVNRPLSLEADGVLTLGDREPHFDGTLNLAKPVGIATGGAGHLTQPWSLAGKLKLDTHSALLDQAEFQYGSEEQGLKLTGVADFKFGKSPRFDGVLSGRQIDLDRVLVAADGNRPPPAAALRELAELGAAAFRPTIPVSIGVGIDQVTLGGGAVQNLRGDISSDADGWNLDRFEFRAPGFTQVHLGGHLGVSPDGVAFTGPAEVNANDPKALAAWLEGRGEAPANAATADFRPFRLHGDVTLGSEKIAVENLTAEFERKTVTGRLAYIFAAGGGRPARLDTALNAPELDLDAALGFGKALLAGSTVERPHDMTIAADIGRATVGGLVMRNASARLKVDAQGLQIDRLAVADLSGGSFSASGRIDTDGHAPRGSVSLDFESGQTAAIAGLLEKFAPNAAKPVSMVLDRVSRAKLHATLDVTGDRQPSMTVAQVAIIGAMDAMNLNVRARVSGNWQNPAAADIRIDGTIDAPQGAALVKLLGLDRYVAVGKGPGQLKLSVNGPADGEQKIDLGVTADNLYFQSLGHGRISLDKGLALNATVEVAKVDLRPLRPAGVAGSGEALPFSLNSRVVLAYRAVTFDDFKAQIGRTNLRGTLSFGGGSVRSIEGTVSADAMDGIASIAVAIGMSDTAANSDKNWAWPAEPFANDAFADFTGKVALTARRFDLSPTLSAREFKSTVKFGARELTIDDITAVVAGGKLTGRMTYKDTGAGLTAQTELALKGADAAALFPSGARPPVTGLLDVTANMHGGGLSPAALIGSLQGDGKFTLIGAQLAGLDPRAFDAVTRAVDQGLSLDAGRISNIVTQALDSGQLSIKRAEGNFAVSAGQVRLGSFNAESKDAELTANGNVDLTDGTLDARLLLSGSSEAAGARPDIFMALRGPLASPSRSIDLSALTGWLTLRAVENQAKRLKAIETAQPPPSSMPKPKSELPPETPSANQAPAPQPMDSKSSQNGMAPALPAPVTIAPAPRPGGPPPASFGSQN